jgi:hypothetical protein
VPTLDPAMPVKVIVSPDLDHIIGILFNPRIDAVIWALGLVTNPHNVEFFGNHDLTKKNPNLIGQRTKETIKKVRRTLSLANFTSFYLLIQ